MPSSGVQTCADRKSTRLNSSHGSISYAVFCLKKKNDTHRRGVPTPAQFGLPLLLHSHDARAGAARWLGQVRRRSSSFPSALSFFFFFNDTAPPEIYPLSLHAALPISPSLGGPGSLVFTGAENDPDTVRTLGEMGFGDGASIAAVIRGWHHRRYRA